jgi:orotate phosphoribosyltransferase
MVTSSILELGLNTESAKKIREIADEVGAFLRGDFTLSSGRKSGHYFDGKKVTLSPEGAYWVGKAIFDELKEIEVDAIGGLAIGADPIVSAVALVSHLEGKPIPSFIVRDERKEHGTKRKIEGHLQEGCRVAIVDDVITTGGSVSKAIEAVEAVNCKVVKVIVLVDRHEGGSDTLKDKGYDFTSILHLWPSGKVTIDEPSTITGEIKARVLP